MSSKELDKIKLVSQVVEEKLSAKDCSELLGITERHVYRLIRRYREDCELGLIHGLRGKASNRSYGIEHRREVIAIYRSRYSDYGPTPFSERLADKHGKNVNRETVRLWMRQAGIATSSRKKRPHRKKRERMSGFGEMVQFAPSENSRDAMRLMQRYAETYGCPRSIYTDMGSVYHSEQTVTDFTRGLRSWDAGRPLQSRLRPRAGK